MVYVLNKDGQPLMPTERCSKVRRLLKQNEAKVINRCPFTIQLQKTKVIRKIKTLFNRKEEGIPLRLIEVGVSCPLLDGKII